MTPSSLYARHAPANKWNFNWDMRGAANSNGIEECGQKKSRCLHVRADLDLTLGHGISVHASGLSFAGGGTRSS